MLTLGLAFAALSGRAHAEDPARVRFAAVRAEGAESCPDGAQIAQDVSARLGRDPFDPSSPRSIDVVLSREGSLWTARLYVREADGRGGTRVLTSDAPSCDRLRAAVALAVALAIDPNAPLASRPATSASPPRTRPPPEPSPRPSPPHVLQHPEPTAWDSSERLCLRAILSVGPLPSPAPAFAVAMDTRRVATHWRATFGAVRTLEMRTSRASGHPEGAFGFAQTMFFASACYGAATSRVSGDACVGAHFGLTSAVVHDIVTFEALQPGDYPWLGMALTLRGALHLWDPIALEAGIEPTLAIVRQRFTLEDRTTIFEQPVLGLNAFAGARVRFW